MTTDLKVVPIANASTDEDEAILASLRIDPTQTVAAVKVLTAIQVRKPPKHEFIRVHPEWELNVSAIELKDDLDAGLFIVSPNMTPVFRQRARPYVLRPYITRASVLKLWPIRLQGADGKTNAGTCPQLRRRPRKTLLGPRRGKRKRGRVQVFEAVHQPPDPEWPADLTLGQMMKLAFIDKRGR